MFEQLVSAAANDIIQLEEQLPRIISEIDARLQSVSVQSLHEVEKAFAAALNATTPTTNEELGQLLSYTRNEAAKCVMDLRKIERWIVLNIPKVEDGNNFGVAVQMEINKMVVERRTKVKELFDKLADYHKDRGALLKEMACKTLADNIKSTTKLVDDETKNGEESKATKTSTKTHSEQKETTPMVIPDQVASVVALDVGWYFHLVFTLETVRDAYVACVDCITKNRAKLERPKGDGAGGMNMF
ncbi:hypothetical protein CTAYLR_005727 [Chrysophaeum taylorii]|uniref:Proteasome activator PA28 C-terminal domain-containing protein n=1 Tax=Chrysophaeum taylorii TaxID=2483200 RepID=A0AAD7XS01_9STRA|nr:hypothetical protein CTAYLR_005727 [Chrysophaeum taylorii]